MSTDLWTQVLAQQETAGLVNVLLVYIQITPAEVLLVPPHKALQQKHEL